MYRHPYSNPAGLYNRTPDATPHSSPGAPPRLDPRAFEHTQGFSFLPSMSLALSPQSARDRPGGLRDSREVRWTEPEFEQTRRSWLEECKRFSKTLEALFRRLHTLTMVPARLQRRWALRSRKTPSEPSLQKEEWR